jgi:hypothetical protein
MSNMDMRAPDTRRRPYSQAFEGLDKIYFRKGFSGFQEGSFAVFSRTLPAACAYPGRWVSPSPGLQAEIGTESLRRPASLQRSRVIEPLVSISSLIPLTCLASFSRRETEGEEETRRIALAQLKASHTIPLNLSVVAADSPIILPACCKEALSHDDSLDRTPRPQPDLLVLVAGTSQKYVLDDTFPHAIL